MVQVYKFGGASVKDASGIKNVCRIIQKCTQPLLVVISAMGKTTNAMEDLVEAYFNQNQAQIKKAYDVIYAYHNQVVQELFESEDVFLQEFDKLLKKIWERVMIKPGLDYDYEYDQIVPFGEMLSTKIVSAYANSLKLRNKWLDVRELLKTDDNYRDAGILWELSEGFVKKEVSFEEDAIYITQGFIGSTINNITTTLGREGSDYSGAILAHILNAESLSIWKDVPGVLNADPRWYPNAQQLEEISYPEAIELAYYGAQVIHPKTLKPLQSKRIPLFVKSFVDDSLTGTVIRSVESEPLGLPVFILKQDQLFITISPKDFSFIMEDNLSDIFAVFSKHKTRVNLMQTSALNFSVCINNVREVDQLIKTLQKDYLVRYNENVELVTIRNYNDNALVEITTGKKVVDSQLSRKTARYVLKKSEWNFDNEISKIL